MAAFMHDDNDYYHEKMTATTTGIDDNDTAKACYLGLMLDDYIHICYWHGKARCKIPITIQHTMNDEGLFTTPVVGFR